MSDYSTYPDSENRFGLDSFNAPDDREDLASVWTGHRLIRSALAPIRSRPFYCNPVILFLAVWLLMLASLSVRVSEVIYPSFGTPLLVFGISAGALLLGYFACTAVLSSPASQKEPAPYILDVTLIWRLNFLFLILALALVFFNWSASGPPPAIGDPSTYLTYGRFKQVLFPLASTIAVNSTLDTARFRRYTFLLFAIGILILYVARGILLVTFLQMFFLFSLRTNKSRKKQYVIALGFLTVAIACGTIFGDLRTAHDIFISFLKIRDKYADWPMAWLWLVSYVSIPFSNLCWIVSHASSQGPSLAFLYPILPTFAAPNSPYISVYASTNIVDNASTYLQNYVLDFSYLGIYFANLLLGIGCGWIVKRAYPRHILILSIFLSAMSLIFFTDMFFLLSTVIQLVVQRMVEKRCFWWAARSERFAHELA